MYGYIKAHYRSLSSERASWNRVGEVGISKLQTQYLHSLCLFNYEREESTNNKTCSLACTESSEHFQILTTVYMVGPVVDPRFNSGVQPISTEDDHQRDQNVGSYRL